MYLLFDIGATNTRIAFSDGKTIQEPQITKTPQRFEKGIEVFKQFIGDKKIQAAAGGTKGPLSPDKNILTNPPNLPQWKNKPIKQRLEETLSVPVFIENDAALGALGEALYGAGKNHTIVVYLTISTGVGGTRIINGQIDKNSFGFEPGHQIIDINNKSECGCGGFGHLEAIIGGASLAKRYGKNPEDIEDPTVWDEVAKNLAIGLNNTIVHWSPDVVVLGGPLMNKISLEKVSSYLKEFLTIFPNPPQIVKASLDTSSTLYGALALLNQKI